MSANLLQALRDLIELAKSENFNRVEILDTLLEVIAEAESAPPERNIVQIATASIPHREGVHSGFAWTDALCNDGTLWSFDKSQREWEIQPPIPQGQST